MREVKVRIGEEEIKVEGRVFFRDVMWLLVRNIGGVSRRVEVGGRGLGFLGLWD